MIRQLQGESCSENFSCKPGHICISKKCRNACKADTDCPAGRLQVIVQTVTTGQLTDAQFEAAWMRIPEEERASSPVNALASRVIAIARPK